jgi:2-keto-3-deoxy-L-rhamnonate aldolase RhmA
MLLIQIESREGLENVDSILADGSVNVVEVGRGDLSTALGVLLELRHPAVS